jgi:hypothetical protein
METESRAAAASLDRQAWFSVSNSVYRFGLGRRFVRWEPHAASAQFEISAHVEPRVEPCDD